MNKLKRKERHVDETLKIPFKANRILNIILIALLLIYLRIWHLAVIQHDEKLNESRKPQRRQILEPATRATILDRFNIPLALNKLQYNAAIVYSQIKQIPTLAWQYDAQGGKFKVFKRREYITALSKLLAKELDMDEERLEDIIHAKASLYNQIPFVLKENISEAAYYKLKMLEKDWIGIHMQQVPWRVYPQGKIASDIVGYMGAINKQEYEKVISEIKLLQETTEALDKGENVEFPLNLKSQAEVRRRLKDLNELSYSIKDSIGKSGIEGKFENLLRGFRGKKSYYSDAKGHLLTELPGTRAPLPGKQIILTLSSELQQYAEELLIENESIRQPIMSYQGPVKKNINADKQPWIKGGAIVAIDPNNGEIIALATNPRFDPNDFIASRGVDENIKTKNIFKWLENDLYLADIWNRQRPLEREVYSKIKGIYSDELPLTWDNYLNFILSKTSALKNSVLDQGSIQEAVMIQKNIRKLVDIQNELFNQPINFYQLCNTLYECTEEFSHGKKLPLNQSLTLLTKSFELQNIKESLSPYLNKINHTYDKVLLFDLLQLAVPGYLFSNELLEAIGKQRIKDYREANGAFIAIQQFVKKNVKDLFHCLDFKQWRIAHEKDFLKQKREYETLNHLYAKPYIDYLDALENKQFELFWQTHQWKLILTFLKETPLDPDLKAYESLLKNWREEYEKGAHKKIEWALAYTLLNSIVKELPSLLDEAYLQTFISFKDLNRKLLGNYRLLRKNSEGIQQEKHLAAAFYPKYGFSYGRSQAYRQAATQGSIFKLVTAYEALTQQYHHLKESGKEVKDLNPLTMIDKVWKQGKETFVGYHADGTPIPRHYKGGRMPKSLSSRIGPLNVLKAIEMSSNPYFSLLAGDVLKSPEDLANAARLFSFGSRTGLDLPGEIGGNIPDDLDYNKTGLYSFAIGQHTLVVTPLQTSVMLSSLANEGTIYKPKLIHSIIGKNPKRGHELITENEFFPNQEALNLIGIDYPLFIASDAEKQKNSVTFFSSEIKREIFLPFEIQKILLEGMSHVVERTQKEGLSSLSKLYRNCPGAISDYLDLKKQFIGKTSTSESLESIDLDLNKGTNIYTHVWFGGVSYTQDILNENTHEFLFKNAEGSAELVVVVYLRFGGYGKEAAPVAAQVAKKWKEIKQKHLYTSQFKN